MRAVRSPLNGEKIAGVDDAGPGLIDKTIEKAAAAFRAWRLVPAPRRGELVRLLGAELRAAKDDLPAWSPSRPARSPPKAAAKCRR